MKELKLTVNGMKCEGCEKRICNVLDEIPGIEKVSASHEKNTVVVTLKEKVEKNIIVEKIEDLGFKVIEEE